MNTYWLRIVTPAVVLMLGGHGHAATSNASTESPAPVEKESASPLHMTAETRAAAGIRVSPPQSVTIAPEVEAYGRVLDPTPYVALVAEEATARAAATASEKEYQRTQKLFAAGGNASAQALEAAEAAAVRDRAAVESAHLRLLAGWGSALAAHADLATLRETLTRGAALIRIDLLPGPVAAGELTTAQVSVLGSDARYAVEVLGPAPVADPQVQGASYLALLRDRSLPAGATLRAVLPGPGESKQGIAVPGSAIVFHEGSAWVYVLGENDTFSRRLIAAGETIGQLAVVNAGLSPRDQVAVTGAQQLLSSELQASAEGAEER
jgi:multidrug efflux system membrane fusion protein